MTKEHDEWKNGFDKVYKDGKIVGFTCHRCRLQYKRHDSAFMKEHRYVYT